MTGHGYRIICKGGYVLTDAEGNIAEDHLGRDYVCEPAPDWRIVGFSTRFNAYRLISLAQAADGEPLGQGWVHDVDHGTRRLWGMPKDRRAVRVERIGTWSTGAP